jgi:hypothetical protein
MKKIFKLFGPLYRKVIYRGVSLYQREYKREHFIVFRFKQKVYSKIKNPKSLVLVFQYKKEINTKGAH